MRLGRPDRSGRGHPDLPRGGLPPTRADRVDDALLADHRPARVGALEPRLRVRRARSSPAAPTTTAPPRARSPARTHPDLAVLSTERIIITIDEVRTLVASSQFSPSVGRYRVVVIEDADRMTERTSNVLLKALEEPPRAHGVDPLRAERGRPHPDHPVPGAHACACACPRSTTSPSC